MGKYAKQIKKKKCFYFKCISVLAMFPTQWQLKLSIQLNSDCVTLLQDILQKVKGKSSRIVLNNNLVREYCSH